MSSIIDTANRKILFENDKKGHLTEIKLPNPSNPSQYDTISSYTYDKKGRLTSQTDALGNTMYFEYKGTLMIRETWRNGTEWEISYDKSSWDAKCLEIRGSGGLFHHKLYYVAPDCTEVINSLGEKTTYFHRDGLVTKRIEPNGGEYEFGYSRTNELEWTVDPLGNTTGELQDELGNVTTITSADGG